MPEMIVCPVSALLLTLKVGSSSARDISALESLSLSLEVFGSTAIEMTGSGKCIDSRAIGWFSSQMVSPVININDEGFGRVLLIVGRLVVLDKTVRDAGRFSFATPQAMQAEAEKLLAVAVGLIGKYPDAARL